MKQSVLANAIRYWPLCLCSVLLLSTCAEDGSLSSATAPVEPDSTTGFPQTSAPGGGTASVAGGPAVPAGGGNPGTGGVGGSGEVSPTPSGTSGASTTGAGGVGGMPSDVTPVPTTTPRPLLPPPKTLELVEYASFPKSSPNPAPSDSRIKRHARINYIGEVPDGSGRMFVPDLNGMMYLVADGKPVPYLHVGDAFEPEFYASAGLGNGFGFVTFHPDFSRNGKFYTVHTEADGALENDKPDIPAQPDTAYHGVITEWTAKTPADDVFSASEEAPPREVFRLGFAGRVHGIQQISFHPTAAIGDPDYGLLYIAVGDGGVGVRSKEPQDLSGPYGKLLRIDPAGRDSGSGKYGIPKDNPFVGQGGALGEIYAYGFRDPHRFSWDVEGEHRLFMGHIGQWRTESVYDILPGDNFGWSEREGGLVFKMLGEGPMACAEYTALPADDAQFGYVYPLAQFDHDRPASLACYRDAGHAISGGFVYRGPVDQLYGKYIFGDLVDGRVMYTSESEMKRGGPLATIHELSIALGAGEELTTAELVGDKRVDLRFGTDAQHNLYLLAKANGKVWKVNGAR